MQKWTISVLLAVYWEWLGPGMVGVHTDLSLSAVQLETPLLQGCLVSI